MKKIKGSCLCKKITFEIKNECRYSVFCHCQMCQASNAEFSYYKKVKKDNYISISTGTLNKNIPSIGHIFYKYKKSKINFSKLKKFPQSAQGYFDKFIYRIK